MNFQTGEKSRFEFVHAFSCAYIELWMHAGSLESTKDETLASSIRSNEGLTLETSAF